MPKLFQINITANWGSHGKITEGIGKIALANGWESHIAFGRWYNQSESELYHIGNMLDERLHGMSSRLFDNHGLMSAWPTIRLIKHIKKVNPDIIHLHNIHGYYLNYPILFKYLAECGKPVVWTLHDCWPYTGHCAHYMFAECNKWKSHCQHCPLLSNYPHSILFDRSYKNFQQKKEAFLAVDNLTIVPVSKWLETEIHESFLKSKSIQQIYNGIDTDLFKPTSHIDSIKKKYQISPNQKIVLGVASNWYRKGMADFIQLRNKLPKDYVIILVGVKKKDQQNLPSTIISIDRTENAKELIEIYSMSNVLFNPTWEDNFPTTIIEALACGTPVVTYKTGGCPEAISEETGYAIERGNIDDAAKSIEMICNKEKYCYSTVCRERAVSHFNATERFQEYIDLYHSLLKPT